MRSKLNVAGIYTITSPSGGVYVGSAVKIRRRWHQHRIELRASRHGNSKLLNAWKKYGEEQMVFNLLLVCRAKDLLLYEQRAIDVLRPRYNVAPIAGNNFGVKWSAEAKKRVSENRKGRKLSDSHRAAIGAAHLGMKRPESTKAKLRGRFVGRKHTDEARAKMKGRVFSDDHIEKLRVSHSGQQSRLGCVVTKDTRAAISAKLKGRKRSPEAIAKHRATMAARRG